jgi:hypothetical protein
MNSTGQAASLGSHQVLCSTESLFLSDFTPTYSGDNSTTQTFDKLCSVLEYRIGSSTGWLKTRGRLQCSRLTHAVRTEDRRMNQLLLESHSQLPYLCDHKRRHLGYHLSSTKRPMVKFCTIHFVISKLQSIVICKT